MRYARSGFLAVGIHYLTYVPMANYYLMFMIMALVMKILVFDTETTGLIQNSIVNLNLQPKIIEFCGIMLESDTWEVIKELTFLSQSPSIYNSEDYSNYWPY